VAGVGPSPHRGLDLSLLDVAAAGPQAAFTGLHQAVRWEKGHTCRAPGDEGASRRGTAGNGAVSRGTRGVAAGGCLRTGWERSYAVATDAKTADLPTLGRPLVDTITGSKIKNLKELRPGSSGTSEVRILFLFDPWRSAILLVAGDKSGKWNRWYGEAIPRAEQLYKGLPEGTGRGGERAMTSYTRWDRAAYIDRVGGAEEAERRRKALMARQSGQRLAEERKRPA
jgi:hypothetical protein